MAVTAIIGSGRQTFYQMIQGIGAATSLDFCLDAAASGSYDGTSQTWVDLTGNGNSFFRGATGSANTDDPTFNGTAGKKTESEYFSVDGGDYFGETAAHTFAESWHKDNAVFTLAGVIYVPSGSAAYVFSNAGPGGVVGISQAVVFDSGGSGNLHIALTVANGLTGALSVDQDFGAGLLDQVLFFSIAIDESVGTEGLTLQTNSTRNKATSTYSSPSSSASSYPYTIAAFNNAGSKSTSGVRYYCEAGWSRRLSDTELDNLYAKLQRRYSALP